ncbi:arylamine N-acetyltransferase family protein [Marinomonas sp. 2405UD68-3]|uniref:arylamine N-acetyltransferase family protein n=1 Tax=Marinomonas sp. 2405UD68-3 TaxID=3391835 RepID=UPI0039C9BA74
MVLSNSLQNYLTDLELSFPVERSLSFVAALQNKHIAKYSFNSLAVVLGEEMPLEVDALSHKIVTRGLGGYCFEHNKLTFELLRELGYEVELKLARVLYNQKKQAPRTHRVTLLKHQASTYLVDTGFGAYGPNAPLLLEVDKEQAIGSETYRIISLSSEKQLDTTEYDVQILKDGAFFTLYRFDLADYSDADCQLAHFFSHKSPNAGFVNNLVISSKSDEIIIALRNHTFMTRINGEEETVLVTTPEALHSRLTVDFGLNIDSAITSHLFERFLAPKLIEPAK